MRKKIQLIGIFTLSFVLVQYCGGKEIKDAEGKKISKVEKIDGGKSKIVYEPEENGVRKEVVLNKEKKEEVSYYSSDKLQKKVKYENGQISQVILYKEDGSIRSIVHYQNGKISMVEIPSQKKKVYYDESGKITKVEVAKQEKQNKES
ncbi:MAG: hypothetical protein D6767_07020 [Candidatus Hydrogenedentota bacterium]|nr:MAG: hypothetical protein D6767_07020 [Candidatus Hydrogenedentota bacterium]